MMSRLRLASYVALALFAVAGCSNNNNGGKKDMSVGGADLSVDVDLASNGDDLAVNPGADLSRNNNGDGGGACTVINVWPGLASSANYDNTPPPAAFAVGFQDATLPTLSLEVDDFMPKGSATAPNTQTFGAATTLATCSANLCAFLSTCVDNAGSLDCSGSPGYLAVGGTATSAADANVAAGRMIVTGTNLKFVEWDFTNDAPVAGGGCIQVNTLNYDNTWPDVAPTDGGTTPVTGPGLYYYDDFAATGVYKLGRRVGTAAATDLNLSTTTLKAWDINNGGTKIAYSAAPTAAPTRFDLVVANADGSGAATRVTLANAGRSVTRIAFSPDGSKIAYFADDVTAGSVDVYVVDTAGATAPVNLSSAANITGRVANAANNANFMAWSRDSHYLAFTGDFTTDRKVRLFIANLTGGAPVVNSAIADAALTLTGTATAGATQQVDWTDTNKVIYKARLAVANSYSMFIVNADGTGAAALGNQPAAPALVGAFSTSPDGKTLAFSASTAAATTAYKIYTMKSDGSAAATDLFAAAATPFVPGANTGPGNFFMPLFWSPDGTKIAFGADYATNNTTEAYVVSAAGGNPVRVAHQGSGEVRQLVWSPDSLKLAMTGNFTTVGKYEVFEIANATTVDQTPVSVKTVTGTGTSFDWTDDSFTRSLKWVTLP